MKPGKNRVVITGPTSSGKTSLALELSKKTNGVILSADSRQIYKHMNIGTGKIPVNSMYKIEKSKEFWNIDGIRVYGYDLVEPGEYFSAYDYCMYALKVIKELESKYESLYVVGGTGLYLSILLGQTNVSNIPRNEELRNELSGYDLKELQIMYQNLNGSKLNDSDINNKVRLIRGIERLKFKNNESLKINNLSLEEWKTIELYGPRKYLYTRVDNWADSIWAELIVEVEKLIKLGYKNTPQMKGLIYKSVLNYLEGNVKKEDAVTRIKYDLHSYVRRQQTYFKKMKVDNRIDVSQDNYKEKVYNITNG